MYKIPPVDDKKGTGVKKWDCAVKKDLIDGSIIRQTHGCDDGESSHMTSSPQRELSEGFENVNFLKND